MGHNFFPREERHYRSQPYTVIIECHVVAASSEAEAVRNLGRKLKLVKLLHVHKGRPDEMDRLVVAE